MVPKNVQFFSGFLPFPTLLHRGETQAAIVQRCSLPFFKAGQPDVWIFNVLRCFKSFCPWNQNCRIAMVQGTNVLSEYHFSYAQHCNSETSRWAGRSGDATGFSCATWSDFTGGDPIGPETSPGIKCIPRLGSRWRWPRWPSRFSHFTHSIANRLTNRRVGEEFGAQVEQCHWTLPLKTLWTLHGP